MNEDISNAVRDAIAKISTADDTHRVLFCYGKVYGKSAYPLATDSWIIDAELGDNGGGLDELGVLDIEDVTGPGIYLWEGKVTQDLDLYEDGSNDSVGYTTFVISRAQEPHGDDCDLEFDGTITKVSSPEEYEKLMAMEPPEKPLPGPWENLTAEQ